MTLRVLEYIVAVANAKHFGRAAKHCHVSQPAMSYAIGKLEARLGVKIFERGQAAIWETPIGEKIIKQATVVLAESKKILQIASSASELSRPLSMGAIYTIAPFLFPVFSNILHEHSPAMPLILQEDLTKGLKEKLLDNVLDLAVVALPFIGQGIVTSRLYREAFVVLLRSGHPLAAKTELSLNHLKPERILLLGEGHCLRTQILAQCPWAEGDGDQRLVTGSSLTTLKAMVTSGAGISILPYTAAMPEMLGSMLVMRPIICTPLYREVVLAWRGSFTRGAAVDVVLKSMRIIAAEYDFGIDQ